MCFDNVFHLFHEVQDNTQIDVNSNCVRACPENKVTRIIHFCSGLHDYRALKDALKNACTRKAPTLCLDN